MANLNGHQAGNGGYRQGDPTVSFDSLLLGPQHHTKPGPRHGPTRLRGARGNSRPYRDRFEISLLKMLKAALTVKFGMTGKVYLTVFADDDAGAIDQDRRVEMSALRGELCITKRQTDAIVGRPLE